MESPLITAQRAHRLAVRYLGRSTLGSPPGSQSQPWSVTTRISCQPASSSTSMRSRRSSTCSFDSAGELALQRMPQLVELAVLGPAAPSRIARLVCTEVLVAAGGQQLAETVRRQRLLAVRRHRKEILSEGQTLDALRYRRHRRLGCRRHRGKAGPIASTEWPSSPCRASGR